MADLNENLDRDGRWEVRVTIYRNGRRVGTADAVGESYDFAVASVTTDLELRRVDEHVPRRRQRERDADGRE